MNRLINIGTVSLLLVLSCTRSNDSLWLDATVPLSGQPAYEYRILDHWDNLDDTVERGYAGSSIWGWTSAELPAERIHTYGKLNQKLGINGVVLNNVNASPAILDGWHLERSAAIADILRQYGIRVYFSINFDIGCFNLIAFLNISFDNDGSDKFNVTGFNINGIEVLNRFYSYLTVYKHNFAVYLSLDCYAVTVEFNICSKLNLNIFSVLCFQIAAK